MEKELLNVNADDFLNDYQAGRRDFNGINLDSIRISNTDLTDSIFTSCKFINVVMVGTKFNSCEFTDVIFDCCNSIEASYTEAKFTQCKFTPKNAFSQCDFFQAVFENTIMACNFTESFFIQAHFLDCKCLGSVYSKSLFGFTVIKRTEFVATVFDDVKLLQACEIDDESVIKSINSFQRHIVEMGKVEETRNVLNTTYISTTRFFRSLGVDRGLLELRASGVSELTGFKTVFISYNRNDEEVATQLREQLEAAGISCWFAPLDMQSGGGVREQIEEAIHKQGRVVLILSENSIRSSWVSFEVECALAEEKKKRGCRLFPIRICDYEKLTEWDARNSSTGENLSHDVLDRFVPDFTKWMDISELGQQVAKLVIAINDSK